MPSVHVPCGQRLRVAAALVFVIEIGRLAQRMEQGRLVAEASLDPGLLVITEDMALGARSYPCHRPA
jgi:hypothetical protein